MGINRAVVRAPTYDRAADGGLVTMAEGYVNVPRRCCITPFWTICPGDHPAPPGGAFFPAIEQWH